MMFHNDPVANEWLKRGDLLKPRLITKAIKLRTNTAATHSALRREKGREAFIKAECRKCGAQQENLAHILGQCIHTKRLRVNRHDEIKDFVKEKVIKNRTVLNEPRINNRDGLFKLDLVVANKGKAFIVDVTVRYKNLDYLEQAWLEKVRKYSSIVEDVKSMLDRTKVEILPIIVGTRGALTSKTREALIKLGVRRKTDWLTISLIAIRSAISIFDKFVDYETDLGEPV